ncbi:adenosylhomocysteinase [Agromyces mediolanus]|uniref:adenosylhomocysteinase n=1 Tax=Agromyces mediolanus TaxID=41986 RepID=UPI0038342D6F
MTMFEDDGDLKLDWAAARMPVLASVSAEIAAAGGVAGKRIGICLTLEPKTANLALALARAGADVAVHCPPSGTSDDVAAALARRGVDVYASATASPAENDALADAFLSSGLEVLIDDGATMIRRLHSHHAELLGTLLGAAEETTSGVRPLRAMAEDGELRIPVLAVNDARSKYLFDNLYGTGQSCVMTFLDLTNLQLAGRTCLVVGYGWVGRGVARHAAAMGARIVVSEIDPIKALQAAYDGHEVAPISVAGRDADVVFTATGLRDTITPEHLAFLRDGVFLAVAGGEEEEIPMARLRASGSRTPVRPGVDEYLVDGRTVSVIADGECMNVSAAEGNPIEVMDLSLSLQAIAAARISTGAIPTAAGVHRMDDDAEEEVARLRLAADGGALEPLTETIRQAMRAW